MSWLDQNYVTCWRSLTQPALWKVLTARSPETEGRDAISGRDLNFADFNGRRHPVSRPCRQATRDRFADIVESLGFRPPLGDAAGNRRALGYKHAGFIVFQRHEKFHILDLINNRAPRPVRVGPTRSVPAATAARVLTQEPRHPTRQRQARPRWRRHQGRQGRTQDARSQKTPSTIRVQHHGTQPCAPWRRAVEQL